LETDITVWQVNLNSVNECDERFYYKVLDDVERQRFHSYKVDGPRREYLVGRALVRTTLSRFAPVEPSDWRFEHNRYGRPIISSNQLGIASDLVFNLSHTSGMVVLAVGHGCELGIDIEKLSRECAVDDVANRYFSLAESNHIRASEGAERVERFFAFWTLKEAYIKARGLGFSLPLDSFAFAFSKEGAPIISFTETCQDEPARWRFLRRSAGSDHRLALAVSSKLAHLTIRFMQTVPLSGKEIEIGTTTLPP
jgi:4'-phosphopantetheinyl transferase